MRRANGKRLAPETPDTIAVEEPLEIQVEAGPPDADGERTRHSIAVTMRTPGHDEALAAGFLWTEGILTSSQDVERIRPIGIPTPEGYRNTVRITLRPEVPVDLERLTRHVYTTSSCGVCGKASLDAVRSASIFSLEESQAIWAPATIHQAPETVRAAQAVFDRTGGLHAAALLGPDGAILALHEDVGRHNALDKLIGTLLLAGRLPLTDTLLLVSGRASFELVQKAAMAGIPILAAVGAPSSLAVSLASEVGMTLLGFVRNERFNIYTGAARIAAPREEAEE